MRMSHALDPDLLARLAPDLRAAVEVQLRQALTAEAELRQHLEAENADLRARNDRLEHLVREFQRARFGPRSEKLHPDQMELAFEGEPCRANGPSDIGERGRDRDRHRRA